MMLGTSEELLMKIGVHYLKRFILEDHIGKLNFVVF